MRRVVLVLALSAAVSGCGSGATVRGALLDGEGAQEVRAVWVVGREGRAELSEGTFELRGLPAGPAELRFSGETGELGRLWIRDLPRGARVTLEEIWIAPASGLAFPSHIELRGARTLTINGIRMAPPERLRGRMRESVTVLALSPGADALLVRPQNERLPDLRVVLTPETEFVTSQGEPIPLTPLAVGDTIQVEGTAEQGYLIATRIVVPSAEEAAGGSASAGGAVRAVGTRGSRTSS